MAKRVNYFRRLIDDKDPASVKRFLGLLMSAFLVIASFFLLFVKVPNANANLLDRCLLYAVIIVCMAIFGLAVEKVAGVLLSVSKTQAAASILTPQPTVTKVDNVEGDVNGGVGKLETNKDQGDAAHDLKDVKKDITDSLTKKEIIG